MKVLVPTVVLLLGMAFPLPAQVTAYPQPPLYFEQVQKGAFIARTPDSTIRVSADGIEFGRGARMRLVGARLDASATALDPQPGTSNYFIGNDRSEWRAGVPHYSKVRFDGVYPGIDLVYHGDGQQIEYDFALAPQADARLLRLSFDDASRLALDGDGNLTVTTASATLRFRKPVAYQDGRPVDAAFTLSRHNVAFRLGAYDRSKPLVIDPTLVYATCFGGSVGDLVGNIVVDAAGNAYIVGRTSSTNFVPAGTATPCQHDGLNCFDGFVMKLSPSGTGVYTTFFGGSGADQGSAIAIDAAGNAYIAGTTLSKDFPVSSPTSNPFQSTLHGSQNAFAAELDATGALVYSTYLGGSPTITFFPPDGATGIAVDSAGNATIGGLTSANDLPLLNPFRSSPGTGFVSKLNSSGSALIFSSYVDGGVNALAGDSAGNAYAAGTSSGTTTATSGAAQSTNGGGFLAKISTTGALVYNTLLGGTAKGVSVDAAGNAYVTGSATSSLVLVNALYSATLNSFVAKVNPAGSAFLYSTYWYGRAESIAVDSTGNAYVSGQVVNTGGTYPLVNALQSAPFGAPNPVLARFSADGSQLLYSTYLTGRSDQQSNPLAVDGAGNVYFTGFASAGDFPSLNPLKPADGHSPFVVKIADANPSPAQCAFVLPTTSSAVLLGPGDTGIFTVTANSGICAWQATSSSPWITITQGATGSGIGAVGFSVALNPTLSQRSGQITVNGLPYTVNQAVPSHVDAAPANGVAGSVARVPVTFVENEVVGDDLFGTLTVTFSVAANAGAPAVSGAMSFQSAAFLPQPQTTSSGAGNITLSWSGLGVSLKGTNKLGELIVPIPSPAATGQTYSVQSTSGKATLGFATLPVDTFAPGVSATVTVANPSPSALVIIPSSAAPGSAALTITVNGEGFVPASTVLWNGSARQTTFVSETKLQAAITTADLAAAGSAQVTVSNAAPGGGQSNALTFMITAAAAPSFRAAGVVNAAGYSTQLSGGDIAAIFGVSLAPQVHTAFVIPLLTQMAGVTVLVDGVPAPLYYVAPGQINFQMPWRLLNQTQTSIAVVSKGISSAAVTIPLVSAAPALLSVNSNGTGQGEIQSADYTIVAPVGSIPGVRTQPGSAGQYISIYCLGLGAVSPPVTDGFAAGTTPPTAAIPQVTIGGIPATVTFSGLAPNFVGLYQVNAIIPAGVPSGPAIPVVFSMGGVTSNTVTIAIQ